MTVALTLRHQRDDPFDDPLIQLGDDGGIDLTTRVRGDDYFEVSAAGAFRGQIGYGGFLRGAKSNLTGRGDFVDVIGGRSSGLQSSEAAQERTSLGSAPVAVR